jgi:ankyrin repeat protein
MTKEGDCRKMKKILCIIESGILLCMSHDVSGVNAHTRKRANSNFDIKDVAISRTYGSIYQKIDEFCKNNNLDSISDDLFNNRLSTVFGLYSLAKKIGYQVRQIEKKDAYFSIDISWPAIKEYAKKVAEQSGPNASPEMTALQELLKEIDNVSQSDANSAKTKIALAQKTFILDKCDKFFDLNSLNITKKQQVKKIFEKMIENYSGYQRIMSVLTVGLLNSGNKGFVAGFTKIEIMEIADNIPSNFSLSDKRISLQERYYNSKQLEEATRVFMHELSHAFHYMITDYFYDGSVPFFIDSALASSGFRDKFFPMLTEDNLDISKNKTLKKIETAISLTKLKEIKDEIGKILRKEKSDNKIAQTLFNMSVTLVKNGFGQVIFGDSWEKSLTETLTHETLAKIIYVRALVFSTEKINGNYWIGKTEETHRLSAENRLTINWKDNEEILTMFGMVPFLAEGKYIILEDRQNEQIYTWRDLKENKEEEKDAKIFRQHALNFSDCESVNKFISDFVNDINAVHTIEAFFENDDSYNAVLFPNKRVHSFDKIASTVPVPGTEDALKKTLLDSEIASISKSRNVTALLLAAKAGLEGVVELLLKNGADIKAVDNGRNTPLHFAAYEGHKKVVEVLLDKGANIKAVNKNEQTALYLAAQNRHEEVVKRLLKEDNGQTALYLAAKNGQEEMLKLLLEDGADINATNMGRTALLWAAFNGLKNAIELLLGQGANINTPNNNNATPLYFAALKNHEEVVKLLLENGAGPNAADNYKQTALHPAAQKGHENVVKLLLENGANPDAVNDSGETALHLAAKNGNKGIVEELLAKGARRDIKDQKGKTPLDLATQKGYKEIEDLLRK